MSTATTDCPLIDYAAQRAEDGYTPWDTVPNDKLRAAVLGILAEQGLSLSEAAQRCGAFNRRHKRTGSRYEGHGDTTWLKRRLGIEPWQNIHRVNRFTACKIARALGIPPVEVGL